MARAFSRSAWGAIAASAVLGLTLAGCAAGPVLSDRLPESLGGMPADAPARPTTPYQYPAVHDMPPPRATAPLSEEDQFKLEKELRTARDRQEAQEGRQPGKGGGAAKKTAAAKDKKAAPVTKKQPNDPILITPAGVKTNP